MSNINNNIVKKKDLDLENLDNIMELIGELLINKSRLESLEIFKGEAKDILSQLDRVTMELHHNIMKIRMIPIGNLFSKLIEKTDDLANRKLEINLQGEDVQIDRNIADKLAAPLMKYFKSAIMRANFNKTNKAEMTIKSYKEGNDIKINIKDSWSKIDIETMEEIIIEHNIVGENTISNMSTEEKMHKLLNISEDNQIYGKDFDGLLKDIAALNGSIKALNGSIGLKEFDEKIILKLTIPLTFAIAQALMVKINDDLFAIPVEDIKETKRISTSEIKKVKDEEVIIYRDKSIPLIDSFKCLNLKRENENLSDKGELEILITNSENKSAALIVDELLNQQDIVFKSMGELLQDVTNISGATIIGDGEIALILDVNDII